MLLFVDGLNKNWADGEVSDWEQMNLQSTLQNLDKSLPFAISRLNRDFNETNSKVEVDDTQPNTDTDFEKYIVGNKRIVSKMPLPLFQQCLVNNFDIRFKKKSVVWPKHIKKHNVI